MSHEIAFFGMLFPSLLLVAVLAALLWFALDSLMLRLGLWDFFWHPPLARLSLYFICLAALGAFYPDP